MGSARKIVYRAATIAGGAALAFIVLAAPAAAEPATPAVYPTGSTATWGSGLGFDTCSAPSIAALRAWQASPYRTLNIYFSGVNRACTQPNLTASWVRAAAALGWRLLPTYFGRQPPCAFGTKPYRYAASNAGYYGTVEAKDAAAKAAALGLLRGSALYADVEHLADTTKSPDPSRGGIGALTWAFVRGRYWD